MSRKPRPVYPAVDADTLWNAIEAVLLQRQMIRAEAERIEQTSDERQEAGLHQLRATLAAMDNAVMKHLPKFVNTVRAIYGRQQDRVGAVIFPAAYESAIDAGQTVAGAVSNTVSLFLRAKGWDPSKYDQDTVADLVAVIEHGSQQAIDRIVCRLELTPASDDEVAQTRSGLAQLAKAEGKAKQGRCLAALLLAVDAKTIERDESGLLPR